MTLTTGPVRGPAIEAHLPPGGVTAKARGRRRLTRIGPARPATAGAVQRGAPDAAPKVPRRWGWRQGHGQARLRAREAQDALPPSPRPTCRPARRPPPSQARRTRAPTTSGSPGSRAAGAGGRPDAGRARRRVRPHPREDEALPRDRPGPPRARVCPQARLLAGPGRGPPFEDGPPDAARHPGPRQGRARGGDPELARGGGRRAGHLQVEVGPVGHRPDDRGARRGHPPPGWADKAS